MKALLIDPVKRELSIVTIEGEGLKGFYSLMECSCIDIVPLGGNHDRRLVMVVDDEGLLKPNFHFGFEPMKETPFSGKAIIIEEKRTIEGDFDFSSIRSDGVFMLELMKIIRWYGDDHGLDNAIKFNNVSRPATYFGTDFDKPHIREKIWEWEAHGKPN